MQCSCEQNLKQQWFSAQKNRPRFCRCSVLEIHLDEETANLRLEDGVKHLFFTREARDDGSDFAADDHIQVAIVDGAAIGCAGAIVVRNEGEVELGLAGSTQEIGAQLCGDNGIVETSNLKVVFSQFLF